MVRPSTTFWSADTTIMSKKAQKMKEQAVKVQAAKVQAVKVQKVKVQKAKAQQKKAWVTSLILSHLFSIRCW